MSAAPVRGVIALLTAQALAFGVMLGLLVVPANSLFLNAYGSKWLPALLRISMNARSVGKASR